MLKAIQCNDVDTGCTVNFSYDICVGLLWRMGAS